MQLKEILLYIRLRLTRQKRAVLALALLILVSNLLLVCLLLYKISFVLAVVIFLLTLVVAYGFAHKFGYFQKIDLMSAAVYLDASIQTKNQAAALLELKNGDLDTSFARQDARVELIDSQLKARLKNVSQSAISFSGVPRRLKQAGYSLPLTWGCLVWILLSMQAYAPISEQSKNLVDLANQEFVPPKLSEDLKQLAKALDQKETSKDQIKEALKRAEDDLKEAISSKGETGESTSIENPQKAPSNNHNPKDPTPTPTPSSLEKKAEQEKNQKKEEKEKNEASKDNSDQKKDDSSNQSQDGKSGSKSENGKQEKDGSQKEQGQNGEGQNQEGEGSGQGNSNKQDQNKNDGSQKQDGKQEGANGQSQQPGEQGKEQNGQDGKEGQSKSDRSQGSQGKEPQSKDGKGQDQKGDAGLEQIQKSLEQVKESLKQAEKNQENQSGGKGQENNKQEGDNREGRDQKGKDQQNGEKEGQNKKENNQNNKKEEGEAQGQPKPSDKQETEQPSQNLGAQDAKDSAQEGSANQDARKSSLPKAGEKRPEEGQLGEEGPGIKGEKNFKNAEINPEKEQYSTEYAGKDSELVKNKGGAKPKTELSDVLMARPEAMHSNEKQKIPLEYRDVIK